MEILVFLLKFQQSQHNSHPLKGKHNNYLVGLVQYLEPVKQVELCYFIMLLSHIYVDSLTISLHINNKIHIHIYILYDYNLSFFQLHFYIENIGENEDYFEKNLTNFFNKVLYEPQTYNLHNKLLNNYCIWEELHLIYIKFHHYNFSQDIIVSQNSQRRLQMHALFYTFSSIKHLSFDKNRC